MGAHATITIAPGQTQLVRIGLRQRSGTAAITALNRSAGHVLPIQFAPGAMARLPDGFLERGLHALEIRQLDQKLRAQPGCER